MSIVENTLQSAYDQVLFLSGQNSTSFPITDAARMFNYALNDYTNIAMTADGKWKMADITSGTVKYTITVDGSASYSLEEGMIAVDQVEYVTADGNIVVLNPTSRVDNKGTSLTETYPTGGNTTEYLIEGNEITPLSTPTSGTINVYSTYAFGHFATSVGTEEFLIPPTHISYCVYNVLNQLDTRTADTSSVKVERELTKWEGVNNSGGKIRDYYTSRDEDTPRRLKPKNVSANSFK